LNNVEWNNISFQCSNSLESINLDRMVINIIPVPLQLGQGIDGGAKVCVGILVHDGNHLTTLSADATTHSCITIVSESTQLSVTKLLGT